MHFFNKLDLGNLELQKTFKLVYKDRKAIQLPFFRTLTIFLVLLLLEILVDLYFLFANLPCQMHSRDSFSRDQKDNLEDSRSQLWSWKHCREQHIHWNIAKGTTDPGSIHFSLLEYNNLNKLASLVATLVWNYDPAGQQWLTDKGKV